MPPKHWAQPLKPSNNKTFWCDVSCCLQYQQDIQTKLKPGDFADRIDDKRGHLADAPDWPTVLRLFAELGENSDR